MLGNISVCVFSWRSGAKKKKHPLLPQECYVWCVCMYRHTCACWCFVCRCSGFAIWTKHYQLLHNKELCILHCDIFPPKEVGVVKHAGNSPCLRHHCHCNCGFFIPAPRRTESFCFVLFCPPILRCLINMLTFIKLGVLWESCCPEPGAGLFGFNLCIEEKNGTKQKLVKFNRKIFNI